MYAASLNVSGMYFHMGTGYDYAAWQAATYETMLPGPRPLYYGHLAIASALAGGSKQVRVLANETSFSAYAIYNSGSASQIDHVVILNLEVYDSTAGGARSSAQVKLPSDVPASVTVRRLTAPGAETANNITWAGQTLGSTGDLLGAVVVETLSNGTINIAASEAVLISIV
ncbi:hypothetical protein BX600DRAFT_439863 [Xylariales sp. PMI_506]|nr:hypothetical protein BX600DRAFT_439863 [Xylariales sp. PMI_506]